MNIYYNSRPIPEAAAKRLFFDANPSRSLPELDKIFRDAVNRGSAAQCHKNQARKYLAVFGLEVIA
jgi:hypothetical protein